MADTEPALSQPPPAGVKCRLLKASRRIVRSKTSHILVAVASGIILGLIVQEYGSWGDQAVVKIASLPGNMWLKALRCIVMPMIVLTMIQAIVKMRELPGGRAIARDALALYFLTTFLAAIEALIVCVVMLEPLLGSDIHFPPVENMATDDHLVHNPPPSLAEGLLRIAENGVPQNIVHDAQSSMFLPVIVTSVLVGMMIPKHNPDGTQATFLVIVSELNEVVTGVITFLMKMSPIGIGSLVFKGTIGGQEMDSKSCITGILLLSVYSAYGFHVLVTQSLLLASLGHRNPCRYMANIAPAVLTALGTSSSLATLPVTTRCSIENNKVRPHVAKFVLSFGATINMDGSTIFLMCATVFLGKVEGVRFSPGGYVLMVVLSVLCSLGSAPVPSAGMVMLATMLTGCGVPLNDSFGLFFAVLWLFDRGMTLVNVVGDATVVAVIDKRFGAYCEPSLRDDGCQSESLVVV